MVMKPFLNFSIITLFIRYGYSNEKGHCIKMPFLLINFEMI